MSEYGLITLFPLCDWSVRIFSDSTSQFVYRHLPVRLTVLLPKMKVRQVEHLVQNVTDVQTYEDMQMKSVW